MIKPRLSTVVVEVDQFNIFLDIFVKGHTDRQTHPHTPRQVQSKIPPCKVWAEFKNIDHPPPPPPPFPSSLPVVEQEDTNSGFWFCGAYYGDTSVRVRVDGWGAL